MICVDTNVVIASLKGAPPELVARFDAALMAGELALPAPVLMELWFGVAASAARARNEERLRLLLIAPIVVVPFDAEDAFEAGVIRAELRRLGTPIGPYDVLIAAQARRRNATLATANLREFRRVPGLPVESWIDTTGE